MDGARLYRQIAAEPGFDAVHPHVAEYLKDYLAGEKAVVHGDRLVINTQFPPYPSRAFRSLVERFVYADERKPLYAVTLAVTNRCGYSCWHCYNAGRSTDDLDLASLRRLASDLQEQGALVVTLTGGEPLLREDLVEICRAFDDRSCLTLNTTGAGLTHERAGALKDAGLFAVGISLDSDREDEHDALRGHAGAFETALMALRVTREAGLYAYVVALATRELLSPQRFWPFLDFAGVSGAREVHLLEPCAVGRLAQRDDVILTESERSLLIDYQHQVARREDLPVLSTLAYLEHENAFGCGAGRTYLYIDGSGEVCPCNLVPLSFGNVRRDPLKAILGRLSEHFSEPRSMCIGRALAAHWRDSPRPMPYAQARELCARHLERDATRPRFFALRQGGASVGAAEIARSYDGIHRDYDAWWLAEAGAPIDDLIARLFLRGDERAFEAGCGSGYATAKLAERLKPVGRILAVDLSAAMLDLARRRLATGNHARVEFVLDDALVQLRRQRDLDLILTTWVLGYIPLEPFFEAACAALSPAGHIALIVHCQASPRRELAIFHDLVAEEPGVLLKQVRFDFPRDDAHLDALLHAADLHAQTIWQGRVVFTYPSADLALDHLLRSGAGTVFYEAIDPLRRADLSQRFLEHLRASNPPAEPFRVQHDYLACIAGR
jgi:MoaA/NifB/PqqE/SkfB family radical SAM enzyme/SAM-dependent methyltransferase